jgi:hypothetical protein
MRRLFGVTLPRMLIVILAEKKVAAGIAAKCFRPLSVVAKVKVQGREMAAFGPILPARLAAAAPVCAFLPACPLAHN